MLRRSSGHCRQSRREDVRRCGLDSVRTGILPRAYRTGSEMALIEDVRALGDTLEHSYQVYVRGRLKFRVGRLRLASSWSTLGAWLSPTRYLALTISLIPTARAEEPRGTSRGVVGLRS